MKIKIKKVNDDSVYFTYQNNDLTITDLLYVKSKNQVYRGKNDGVWLTDELCIKLANELNNILNKKQPIVDSQKWKKIMKEDLF